MKTFLLAFRSLIHGSLSWFDRIRFCCTQRHRVYPPGLDQTLYREKILLRTIARQGRPADLGRRRRLVVNHLVLDRRGRPVVWRARGSPIPSWEEQGLPARALSGRRQRRDAGGRRKGIDRSGGRRRDRRRDARRIGTLVVARVVEAIQRAGNGGIAAPQGEKHRDCREKPAHSGPIACG